MRYVIGDIHGMYEKMTQALDYSGFDPDNDTLYGLGDFADRGPDSLKVIDYLMSLRDFRSVFGNHDMWLYQFLRSDIRFVDSENFVRGSYDYNYEYCGDKVLVWPEDSLLAGIETCWDNNGGRKTMESFAGTTEEKRKAVLSWLEKMPYRIESDDFIIQHTFPSSYARFFPDGDYTLTMKDMIERKICRRDYDEALWNRELLKCSKAVSGRNARNIEDTEIWGCISHKTMIIGHSPTPGFNLRPVPVYDSVFNFILIDTGSFVTKAYGVKEDGAITVYNMDTSEWHTSSGESGIIKL